LRKETAGRVGKPVIIVERFENRISSGEIEELAKNLRKKLGCGGAVEDRFLELQCYNLSRIRELLEKEGFKVRGEK
jgi:translation initiation factor 1